MEQNIRDSRARSELIPGIPLAAFVPQGPPQGPQRSPRVRTISGMDDVLLAELRGGGSIVQHQQKQRQNATTIQTMTTDKFGKPPLPSGTIGSRPSLTKTLNSMELSPDRKSLQHTIEQVHPFRRCESVELMGEKLLDCPIITEQSLSELENKSPPSHTRRNTGGTIYIQNTMTNPDIQATIKCVCGVYRAHIVQAAERKSMRSPVSVNDITFDTDVFSDDYGARKRRKKKTPSLAEVLAFYDEFYRRSRMEHDAIIMSLIYVERLVKGTNGVVSPTPENWRSILFACMVLASKVWDDLSMWNVDFSNVSAHTAGLASFTLKRINQLELALLKSLNFDVKVPASEYAKYYFLIRTMLIRSGLVKEIEKPLGKEEAFNKLETRASDYQNTKLCRPSHSRRVKSLDGTVSTWLVGDKESSGPVLRDTVCLEQIIVG